MLMGTLSPGRVCDQVIGTIRQPSSKVTSSGLDGPARIYAQEVSTRADAARSNRVESSERRRQVPPPVRAQRARHRQGGGDGGGPSFAAARRASNAKQRLQEGGATRLVQDKQGRPARTLPPRAWAAREAPTGWGRRWGAILCGGKTGKHR